MGYFGIQTNVGLTMLYDLMWNFRIMAYTCLILCTPFLSTFIPWYPTVLLAVLFANLWVQFSVFYAIAGTYWQPETSTEYA